MICRKAHRYRSPKHKKSDPKKIQIGKTREEEKKKIYWLILKPLQKACCVSVENGMVFLRRSHKFISDFRFVPVSEYPPSHTKLLNFYRTDDTRSGASRALPPLYIPFQISGYQLGPPPYEAERDHHQRYFDQGVHQHENQELMELRPTSGQPYPVPR